MLGKKKAFCRIIIIEGLLNVFLLFILVPKLQHIGAAISTTFVELFIAIAMLIVIKIENIPVFR